MLLLVMIMDKKIYKKIADMHKAEESRGKNALVAFIVGGIVGIAAAFCIVVHEMLGRSDDAVLLKALTHLISHIGGKQNVLTKGFNGAAPSAITSDVQHRSQRLFYAYYRTFLADDVGHISHERIIEG